MAMFQVHIDPAKPSSVLDGFRKIVSLAKAEIVQEAGRLLYDYIAPATPVGEDPDHAGTLKGSWVGVTQVAGGASFGNVAPYANILEEGLYKGTGPRTIKAGSGVYSTQAIGGMIEPFVQSEDFLDQMADRIANKLLEKL